MAVLVRAWRRHRFFVMSAISSRKPLLQRFRATVSAALVADMLRSTRLHHPRVSVYLSHGNHRHCEPIPS